MAYSFLGSGDNGDPSSGTTLSVSATYTGGERVWVLTTCSATPTTQTVTDGTNTYSQKASVSTGGDILTIWECSSVVAGTYSLVQTVSPAQVFRGIQFARYSGVTGTSIVAGQFLSAPGTGTDLITSGNITPSAQPGVLVSFVYSFSGPTILAGTGFTIASGFPTETTANGDEAFVQDRLLTSTSAVSATATSPDLGGTTNFVIFAIFAQQAASGGSISDQTMLLLRG